LTLLAGFVFPNRYIYLGGIILICRTIVLLFNWLYTCVMETTVQNLHEHLGKMSENGTLDLHFTCLNVFD